MHTLDDLKGQVLDNLVEVKSRLNELFEKYKVSSYEELMARFEDIPEEEGFDDYFLAQNLEYMRRKLEEVLEVLEERVEKAG